MPRRCELYTIDNTILGYRLKSIKKNHTKKTTPLLPDRLRRLGGGLRSWLAVR